MESPQQRFDRLLNRYKKMRTLVMTTLITFLGIFVVTGPAWFIPGYLPSHLFVPLSGLSGGVVLGLAWFFYLFSSTPPIRGNNAPDVRYSFGASTMRGWTNRTVRLDLMDQNLKVYDWKGSLLLEGNYSGVTHLRYKTGPIGIASTMGGFLTGPTPDSVRISVEKRRDIKANWDNLGKSQDLEFAGYGEEGKKQLSEIYSWLHEKVTSAGGRTK